MSPAEVETVPVLGPELAGTLMTPEEFDAVEECDELYVYEIIHGVLIVNPPPLETERGPNEELGYLLRYYRDHHPQGASLDWTLSEHHVRTFDSKRRADRVIWAGLGRVPNVRRELPTIVVEFVSAGKRSRQRDYVEKQKEYLELGIKEYWLFDRFRRILTVFRALPASPPEQVLQANETYRTPLLPGFELPLAQIFKVVDLLEQAE